MNAHTQGRISPVGNALLSGRDLLGVTMVFEFGEQVSEENARRLAACWNALEGVPTDAIEALPADSLEAARKFVLRLAQDKGEPS